MAKPRKRDKRCPYCNRWFSSQGLVGHLRWKHDKDAKTGKALKTDKGAPVLVKPRREIGKIQTLDLIAKSPCCNASLLFAKDLFGVEDKALNACWVCKRCGEWYRWDVILNDKGIPRGTKLTHLPQEVVSE